MPAAPSPQPTARVRVAVPAVVLAVVLAVALAGVGAGCSAGRPPVPAPSVPPAPSAPVTSAIPAGARSLADIGIGHGPADRVYVPADAVIVQRVDQPNVVTLTFERPAGGELAAFYAATVPGRGFTVTGRGGDSLTFTGGGWDGAFTAAPTLSGLTLRRQSGAG